VKELALEGRVEIPDLIEEDGPVLGGLELPDLELVRAGERPALVPEQLALEELARDRRTVHLDERPGAARPPPVHRPRHEILAGTGFPQDQDRDIHGRDLTDDLPDLLHLGAAPERALLVDPVGQGTIFQGLDEAIRQRPGEWGNHPETIRFLLRSVVPRGHFMIPSAVGRAADHTRRNLAMQW
jgi:hypothetical protein